MKMYITNNDTNYPKANRGTVINYKPFDKFSKKVIKSMIKKVSGAEKVSIEFNKLRLMDTKNRMKYVKTLRKALNNKN